jgi:hypothetical protein
VTFGPLLTTSATRLFHVALGGIGRGANSILYRNTVEAQVFVGENRNVPYPTSSAATSPLEAQRNWNERATI